MMFMGRPISYWVELQAMAETMAIPEIIENNMVLLRVARVAESLYGGIEAEYRYKGYMSVPDICDDMGELGKALKEVEDLL